MPKRAATYRPRPQQRPAHCARKDGPRGYDRRRWKRFRLSYLREHPLCVHCRDRNLVVEATRVDHITPHKGDMEAFWAGPFQALCESCHNRKSAKEKT